MKVALYGRVSTDGKGQDAENQLEQLRAFAVAQKWELVGEYVDHVSGSGKVKRPEFERLFADAEAKRVDLVLFWSLDRFSREGVLRTLSHLERLDEFGCGWRSFTEQYLDSCGIFKEAVMAILAVVAKQERLRISERTKAGMHRKMREGMVPGRRAVPKDETLIRKLRADGLSLAQVARAVGLSKTTVSRLTS